MSSGNSDPPLALDKQPQADSGLRCLTCDYNLTGMTGDTCPECGVRIDWLLAQQARDQDQALPAAPWDRAGPGPISFVRTVIDVAFRPRHFARELPFRPRVRPAMTFACLCMALAVLAVAAPGGKHDRWAIAGAWSTGVACHILMQSYWLAIVARPPRVRFPSSFWIVVAFYTSYPLLAEAYLGPPMLLMYPNIWPLCDLDKSVESLGGDEILALWPSVVYWFWWGNLTVIVSARMGRRDWWRSLLAMLPFPIIGFLASATAFFGGVAFRFLTGALGLR